MVRLTDRPDMILDVYRGCKTIQQQIHFDKYKKNEIHFLNEFGRDFGTLTAPSGTCTRKMVQLALYGK